MPFSFRSHFYHPLLTPRGCSVTFLMFYLARYATYTVCDFFETETCLLCLYACVLIVPDMQTWGGGGGSTP